MKMIHSIVVGAVLVHGCAGLHYQQSEPVHTTWLIDSTASIVPESFDQAMQVIASQVDRMNRGDCLTVIPIISDSDSIPSAEIVRACAPVERQPYDQDLKAFHEQLRKSLQQESKVLSSKKADRTDILGTIKLVDQELMLDPPQVRKKVVVFSDFIEEDGARNFVKSPDLANVDSAQRLARNLADAQIDDSSVGASRWRSVHVLLGGLQSSVLPSLNARRRNAVHGFWEAYLKEIGSEPLYVSDGPGMSARFLSE